MNEQSHRPKTLAVEDIHMPANTGIPFVMSFFFFLAGFGFTMTYWWLGFAGLLGVGVCLYARSFTSDEAEYWIPAQEVIDTEKRLRKGGSGDGVHARIV